MTPVRRLSSRLRVDVVRSAQPPIVSTSIGRRPAVASGARPHLLSTAQGALSPWPPSPKGRKILGLSPRPAWPPRRGGEVDLTDRITELGDRLRDIGETIQRADSLLADMSDTPARQALATSVAGTLSKWVDDMADSWRSTSPPAGPRDAASRARGPELSPGTNLDGVLGAVRSIDYLSARAYLLASGLPSHESHEMVEIALEAEIGPRIVALRAAIEAWQAYFDRPLGT